MKCYLVVILVVCLLILFSSCARRGPSLEEQNEAMSVALYDISEHFSSVYLYYIEHDDTITEQQALSDIESISNILFDNGY